MLIAPCFSTGFRIPENVLLSEVEALLSKQITFHFPSPSGEGGSQLFAERRMR